MPKLPNGMYMDGWLQKNLDAAKDLVKKDHDIVIVGDGPEGAGKSVMLMQVAHYLDPTFNLDRVCFTAQEFMEAVKNAGKYQAVLFDEAFRGLSSRQSLSPLMEALIKMFAEIRQKNLFIIVVMPCFFELTKYIAMWRSRALIHVYLRRGQRGSFAFYGPKAKRKLYIYGKQDYNYGKSFPSFRGSFSNFYVLNEKDYREKKFNAFQSSIGDAIKLEEGRKNYYRMYQKQYQRAKSAAEKLKKKEEELKLVKKNDA